MLRNIERKIGGLFEGAFNRTFRSAVQPVELARKLAKEMDEHKTISIHRVYVPDEYTIFLNTTDRQQFAAYETQMRTELAEYLVEHARREGYSLPRRPLVLIETADELAVGTFGIAVDTQDEDAPAAPEPPMPPPLPPVEAPMPAPEPVPVVPVVGAETMVYTPPEEPAEETATVTWGTNTLRLEGRVTVIGRSSECEIPLEDPNVSRRHAEIRRIGEGYSLVDLGSTNGTEVNGQRIQETALMNGDVIELGTTSITFERRLG